MGQIEGGLFNPVMKLVPPTNTKITTTNTTAVRVIGVILESYGELF